MLRFSLVAALTLAVLSSMTFAEQAQKGDAGQTKDQRLEKFLNGTDTERDAMLRDVAKSIADNGYRDLSVLPWMVMMATNSNGMDVLLLVDPVSNVALELDRGPLERDAASASEIRIPKMRQ